MYDVLATTVCADCWCVWWMQGTPAACASLQLPADWFDRYYRDFAAAAGSQLPSRLNVVLRRGHNTVGSTASSAVHDPSAETGDSSGGNGAAWQPPVMAVLPDVPVVTLGGKGGRTRRVLQVCA